MTAKTEIYKLIEKLPKNLQEDALQYIKNLAQEYIQYIPKPETPDMAIEKLEQKHNQNPPSKTKKKFEITTVDLGGFFDNINIRDYAYDDEDE